MSFSDPIGFTPLFNETLARIRARLDADVNAGLVETDPGWIDTREGSMYWILTQVFGLEAARLWDALGSETPAAAFPSLAWGPYLDAHGNTFALTRKPAIAATGLVVFAGTPGTLIATGTQVSSSPISPSQ